MKIVFFFFSFSKPSPTSYRYYCWNIPFELQYKILIYLLQKIVRDKKAALLLDKLLVALQKAVNEDEIGKTGGSKSYAAPLEGLSDFPETRRMELADGRGV